MSSNIDEICSNEQLDSSISTTNLSSIRSSKRRVKKGSAVVLNTDRLQKYIKSEPLPSTAENTEKKETYNNLIRNLTVAKNELNVSDLTVLQRNCAQTIILWWKSFVKKRILNYLQCGLWSQNQSDKVFSLFLGYRVRCLMKTSMIASNLKAQHESYRILMDMCISGTKIEAKADANMRNDNFAALWKLLHLLLSKEDNSNDLLLMYPKLSHTDMILGKSLAKQLLAERQKLHTLLFQCCKWRHFPKPGYWDFFRFRSNKSLLDSKTKIIRNDREAHVQESIFFSPARKLNRSPNKINMTTPPNIRRAVQLSSLHANIEDSEFHLKEEDANNNKSATIRPPPLGDVFATKLDRSSHNRSSNNDGDYTVPNSSNSSSRHNFTSQQYNNRHSSDGQGDGGSSYNSSSNNNYHSSRSATSIASSVSLNSVRHRSSNKGHIQLDILSADRLMPARKGTAPQRDTNGDILADRIPCLRVRLMLPNWTTPQAATSNYIGGRSSNTNFISPTSAAETATSSSSSTLKKVHQEVRDFTTVTLNPKWDTSFTLHLPCTKQIVQGILANNNTSSSSESLTDSLYDYICKSLLQWWSLGSVIIEVFDGERFNQEIFMGQIELLLSGFMVLIRKVDDLEIKGSFQLGKCKPTDRVSGTVRLHAYLHVPQKTYIAELLGYQLNNQQQQQQPQASVLSTHSSSLTSSSDRLTYESYKNKSKKKCTNNNDTIIEESEKDYYSNKNADSVVRHDDDDDDNDSKGDEHQLKTVLAGGESASSSLSLSRKERQPNNKPNIIYSSGNNSNNNNSSNNNSSSSSDSYSSSSGISQLMRPASPATMMAMPPPGGVVFSSKFMQTLHAHSKRSHRNSSAAGNSDMSYITSDYSTTTDTNNISSTNGVSENSFHNLNHLNPPQTQQQQTKSLSASPSLSDPQLEESNNIKFHTSHHSTYNDITSTTITKKTPTASSLKEKIGNGSSNSNCEPNLLNNGGEVRKFQFAGKLASRRQRVLDAAAVNEAKQGSFKRQEDEMVVIEGVVSDGRNNSSNRGGSIARSKEQQQSVDNSSSRRRDVIGDITKKLAGLTALQQSTDAILGSLNQQLEDKRTIAKERMLQQQQQLHLQQKLGPSASVVGSVVVAEHEKENNSGSGYAVMNEYNGSINNKYKERNPTKEPTMVTKAKLHTKRTLNFHEKQSNKSYNITANEDYDSSSSSENDNKEYRKQHHTNHVPFPSSTNYENNNSSSTVAALNIASSSYHGNKISNCNDEYNNRQSSITESDSSSSSEGDDNYNIDGNVPIVRIRTSSRSVVSTSYNNSNDSGSSNTVHHHYNDNETNKVYSDYKQHQNADKNSDYDSSEGEAELNIIYNKTSTQIYDNAEDVDDDDAAKHDHHHQDNNSSFESQVEGSEALNAIQQQLRQFAQFNADDDEEEEDSDAEDQYNKQQLNDTSVYSTNIQDYFSSANNSPVHATTTTRRESEASRNTYTERCPYSEVEIVGKKTQEYETDSYDINSKENEHRDRDVDPVVVVGDADHKHSFNENTIKNKNEIAITTTSTSTAAATTQSHNNPSISKSGAQQYHHRFPRRRLSGRSKSAPTTPARSSMVGDISGSVSSQAISTRNTSQDKLKCVILELNDMEL